MRDLAQAAPWICQQFSGSHMHILKVAHGAGDPSGYMHFLSLDGICSSGIFLKQLGGIGLEGWTDGGKSSLPSGLIPVMTSSPLEQTRAAMEGRPLC